MRDSPHLRLVPPQPLEIGPSHAVIETLTEALAMVTT